ncbi:MAG TPA: arylesterase [Burkholderiales bacterium]
MNSLLATRAKFITLYCFAFLAGLAACESGPKLAPLASNAVVLAFGDSLTYGTGAAESDSYPAQLERLIGRKVISAGVPGETSAQALARLPGELDEYAPRLLLLCTGGNDFLRRLGNAQAARNVRAMVELARSRGIDVLLLGTPEPSLVPSPPEFYAEIAEELDVPYEGEILSEVLRDSSLKSDPVHPNARGYRLIAERIAERLKQAGAI